LNTKEELIDLVNAAIPLSKADIDAWAAETAKDATTKTEPAVPIPQWPKLKPEALYGLAGDFVRIVEPHTEADPVALLVQFLVSFGNIIGSRAYFSVEADRHHGNLFVALVGDTSKARKGTSFGHVLRLFQKIDQDWADNRRMGGLSSGEGLIEHVRDATESDDPKSADPGVEDKRLLVVESELSHVLKQLQRQGNTLSDTLRRAWDGDILGTMTRKQPLKATGAHVSLISHITKNELIRLLKETEAANGLGNRFLWACVRRSKVLPEGGNLTNADLQPLVERLRLAVSFAQQEAVEIRRDDDAREGWRRVYEALSEGKPGLLGSMIARAEAQVVRLSMLFALLDCSKVVRRQHLLAGLAAWDYCEESARYTFGDSLGDPTADTILSALRAAGTVGMTRTEIRDYFGRNKGTAEIQRALAALASLGLARMEITSTKGRSEERWFAVRH
jgi:hypothetical protein